jgi:ABC-2 type transport system ATP-binding protein
MSEVEDLCDRVAIISRGRVIHEGSLDELIATTAGRYELRTTDDAAAAAIAHQAAGIGDVATAERGLTFSASGETAVAALSLELAQAGIGLQALVPRTATLEELFFRLTEGAPEPVPEPRPAPEEVIA